MQTSQWHVAVELEEDDTHTHAEAMLRLPDGRNLTSHGEARRNPHDQQQPRIGEEIATARALLDLVHQLVEAATVEIESVTHRRAHITV